MDRFSTASFDEKQVVVGADSRNRQSLLRYPPIALFLTTCASRLLAFGVTRASEIAIRLVPKRRCGS